MSLTHSPVFRILMKRTRLEMDTQLFRLELLVLHEKIRRLFEKFVDWRQCVAVMQREAKL
jgi:hypothetical protein